jgi:hypothetical protein
MSSLRRLARDETGQSLPIVLVLVLVLFLLGSALATHASVALRTTSANEGEAGDLYAGDAGVELGIWWHRQGLAGNPPALAINGVSVTSTVTTTGATGGGGAGWRQSGFTPQSTSATTAAGPAAYNARWSTPPTLPQGAVVASPTVASDGYVYAGATNGLYAYAPDGAVAWSFLSASQAPAVGAFIGSPAILTTGGGAKMIVAATDGGAGTASTVFGLSENASRNGVTIAWSYSLGNGAGIGFVAGAKLNLAGTRAYLAAQNAALYAFDTGASGAASPLWTAATGGPATVPATLNASEDRVYAATSTGLVRAYDAVTGAQRWSRTVAAGYALTGPAFATVGTRDHVYVATGADRTLRAIRDVGNSSTQDWSLALGADARSGLALRAVAGSQYIFAATDGGTLWKVVDQTNTAAVTWSYAPTAAVIRSDLALDASGATYLGDGNGTLFRIADGGASASTAWSRAVGLGAIGSGVVIGTDSDLYLVTASGRLAAVGPAPSGGTMTVAASAGAATVTATYPDSRAAAPVLSTWTTTR